MQQQAALHNSWLSVLMVDIDHFKRFNDYFGHTEGDRCLSIMASILRVWASSHSGFLGRYGGEEFMVIVPHADPNEAYRVSEHIREQIERHSANCLPPSTQFTHLTVTIGVSSLEGEDIAGSIDALVEAAD